MAMLLMFRVYSPLLMAIMVETEIPTMMFPLMKAETVLVGNEAWMTLAWTVLFVPLEIPHTMKKVAIRLSLMCWSPYLAGKLLRRKSRALLTTVNTLWIVDDFSSVNWPTPFLTPKIFSSSSLGFLSADHYNNFFYPSIKIL